MKDLVDKPSPPSEEAIRTRYLRPSPFHEWCEREGLPVIGGYGVSDLRTVPLAHWARIGGDAAYCHLEGSQGFVGALVVEIPPGGNLLPIRHLYEEQILILEGQGTTQFWSEQTEAPLTIEWEAGALFSPPINTRHQHFNTSSSDPVRFVAANNAPLIFNTFNSPDFIFNLPYEFTDRFSGQEDYFSSELKEGELEDLDVNFVPNVYDVPLDSYRDRGIGFSRVGVALSGNQMVGHIMSIESGTYRKAHRHVAGAQVIVLSGEGYTLMWPPGGEYVRVDWRKGSLVVPPEGWYHHHFVYSREPARHLALRRGLRGVGKRWLPTISEHEGGHAMEHEDEPPEIREMYQEELAKRGVSFRMAPLRS